VAGDQIVLTNSHYTLVRRSVSSLLILRRSLLPFTTRDEFTVLSNQVVRAIDPAARPTLRLLLDLREQATLGELEFDSRTRAIRIALFRDFLRFAILVKSSAAKLQIQKVAREDEIAAQVFIHEPLALAFLES
jgi:hypothetical protein